MSISAVAETWMHTTHLGMYQWMFGSVLWLLVNSLMPDTPTAKMRRLQANIRAYYKVDPTPGRDQNIKRSMFEREDHKCPLLKGQAGEIKRLSKALLPQIGKARISLYTHM